MSDQDWMEINEQHLAATLNWLRLKLQQLIPASQTQDVRSQQETADESVGGWFKRKSKKPQDDSKQLPPPLSLIHI